MARLSDANVQLAKEIIGRYPKSRSATIPLLHLAQQQDGYITNDAIRHIGELVGATSAEVLGTCTFYEMFKMEPVGKYLVNICGTMSCALLGSEALMHHAEQTLGVKSGSTTTDGLFTLEHAECQAACTEAPSLQVNYRHRGRVTNDQFDQLVDDQRIPEAIKQYEQLVAASPTNPDFLRDWGKLVLKDKSQDLEVRKREAVRIWNQIVANRPDDAITTAQVADLFRQSNLNDEAMALYQKAVTLAPGDPQYREYLGDSRINTI